MGGLLEVEEEELLLEAAVVVVEDVVVIGAVVVIVVVEGLPVAPESVPVVHDTGVGLTVMVGWPSPMQ